MGVEDLVNIVFVYGSTSSYIIRRWIICLIQSFCFIYLLMMAGARLDLPSLKLFDVETNKFIKILVTETQKERAERDSLYAKTIIENYRELQCNPNIENKSPNIWEGHSLPEEEIEEVAVPSAEDNTVQYTASTNEGWSEEETLLLISLYGDHEDFAKAKKRKQVWTMISERMSALGY